MNRFGVHSHVDRLCRPSEPGSKLCPERQASLRPKGKQRQSGKLSEPEAIVHAFFSATAIAAASSIFAQPANAWTHAWRPRRHHRRLGEWQREPDLGRYSKEALEARQAEARDANVQDGTRVEETGFRSQIADLVEQFKAAVLRQEQTVATGRKSQQFHASQSFPASPYSKGRGFSPLGTGLLVLVALILARWLWGLLQNVQWNSTGKRKGRWVRDRGLGGKMVFVPEDEMPPPRLVSNSSTAGAASPASVSGRTAPSDPWETAEATGADSQSTPAWWSPPPSIYVEASYRREAQQEAQGLIKRLMSAKIAGQDYDIATLVAVRQLCGETGASVDAKTQRDPLFRAAADAAAHDASEQTNQLGGQSPGKFLSGLATDLGVEEKDAVNMVSAVVASRARNALITACAGYREGDNNEVLVQLLKLAGVITALPLPEKSAHAEMVAAGLQQRATLPERQAIFLTYGCMDPPSASLIAELLGFQPELVLPQLQKHIDEGRKAASNLTQQTA